MVGTSPNVRGGIASLVRSYYNSGLFRRFDMRYVPTHCDGTAAQKAVTALKAYVSLSGLLLTSDAPGQSVTLTILRDGKQMDVSVTLGTRPENL